MRYHDELIGNTFLPAIHGGTLGAMLEMAAIFHLLWETETETVPKIVNITVDYLRSARPLDVIAAAKVTKQGRRMVNVFVEAWQDDRAKPVATAQAHFLVKSSTTHRRRSEGRGMDFESFKTPHDGTVRDGAVFEAYRQPAALLDSNHPKIMDYAARVAGAGSDRDKALRLYYAVRDGLRYDPYNTPMQRTAYRASATLEAGHGYCVNKAGLMAALCRASGIPARGRLRRRAQPHDDQTVGRADGQRRFLLSRLHRRLARRPLGKSHARLQQGADRPLRAQAARLGCRSDSIYHPFDLSGRRHMEYLAYRGVFADIPFDEIQAAFRHYYPGLTKQQEEMTLGGDFAAEAADK